MLTENDVVNNLSYKHYHIFCRLSQTFLLLSSSLSSEFCDYFQLISFSHYSWNSINVKTKTKKPKKLNGVC